MNCVECINKRATARRLADPKKHQECQRKWVMRNPESARNVDKRWIAANKEQRAAIVRNWKTKSGDAARRLMKRGQTPPDEYVAIIAFYMNRPVGYEVDHIIPLARGGIHCLANLQYLTIIQNRKKGAKLDWQPLTMIFGGPHDKYQERYTSFAAAVEGHNQAVELAMKAEGKEPQ
jgi:hypothetical protein